MTHKWHLLGYQRRLVGIVPEVCQPSQWQIAGTFVHANNLFKVRKMYLQAMESIVSLSLIVLVCIKTNLAVLLYQLGG